VFESVFNIGYVEKKSLQYLKIGMVSTAASPDIKFSATEE
jgi:hypothetical protein